MRLLLIPLLAACSQESTLPTDTLQPPASMTLTGPDRLFIGQVNTFTVTGNLGQQELVYLVSGASGLGAGPCPPALGGHCLSVLGARLAGQSYFDDTSAVFEVVLPPAIVAGTDVHYQAGVIRGRGGIVSVLSNTTSHTAEAYVLGCTDVDADNYNPAATVDDGTCQIPGCTDPDGDNYDPTATYDDGTCQIGGCTNASASNYDPTATYDDGSCIVGPNPGGSLLIPTSAWVDPSPPAGWTQCGGFINTSGNDVTTNVFDNCLNTNRLRMRVWNSAGSLTDDIYATGMSMWAAWPDFNYLGGSPTVVLNTHWNGSTTFFTDHGGDACFFSGYNSGFSLGNGNGNTLNISPADNDNTKEIRINCNGVALLNYKVALYR